MLVRKRTVQNSVPACRQAGLRTQKVLFLSSALCILSWAASAHAAGVQLTVNGSNTSGSITVNVYPNDQSNLGNGVASFTRSYVANTRIWMTAPLRSGNNYFIKWQKDGADFDQASTISFPMDLNHTLTAVYETPACTGVTVNPGIDSIKNAVAANPATGTIFCIKAGVHRFISGGVVPSTNAQFIGEPGAILNGSKVITFTQSGSYWRASGQTQQESYVTGDPNYPICDANNSPQCVYPERVFLDNADLTQVNSLAALSSGKFYFDYPNDMIYIADDPTGHTVEATSGSGGLVGFSGSTGAIVKNLIIEKFGGGYVPGEGNDPLKGSNMIIRNNELRHNSGAALKAYGSASVARNNYIHDNGQYGLGGDGLIEGNVVSHNNIDGYSIYNDAGASKFLHTINMILRGNVFSDNIGTGIWSDYDNLNATYENNVVLRNTAMGIDNEVNCGGIIRYNLLKDNNTAAAGNSIGADLGQIGSRSSRDLQVYGNDVIATGVGVNGIAIRGDGGYTGMPNCGTSDTLNVSVHDNVVRMDASDLTGYAWTNAALNNVNWTHNTYVLDSLTNTNFVYDSNYQHGAPVTFALWQSMFGQDMTGSVLLSAPTAVACDVNGDGTTNVLDVQLEANMAVNVTACTHDINQDGACNVIDVQRVVNNALGGQCVSP